MAGRGGGLTSADFKEQFERVSRERYEEEPEVLEAAVRNARDLRGDANAREENEHGPECDRDRSGNESDEGVGAGRGWSEDKVYQVCV